MAAATNSTLGTVALAGDLAGTATVPELAPTGVKANSYTSVSKIHVDSKGRIQWCGGANYTTDLEQAIPLASTGEAGIFRVGPNINIASGEISVNPATTSQAGICKVGNNLEINQSTGAVDIAVPAASASQKGTVQVGSGFDITGGILSRDGAGRDASASVKGVVQIGANISYSSGTISIPFASETEAGVAPIDNSNFYKDPATQTLYPHAARPALYGMVFGWSNDFALDGDGKLTYTSPYTSTIASASTLGMVKIGDGLFMNGDDALTVAEDASASTKGLVEVGGGFSVSSGVLSADIGSSSGWGLIGIDTTAYHGMSYNTTPLNSPGYPENGTSGLRFRRCDTESNPANIPFFGVVRSANLSNITINNGVMDIGVNIAKKNVQNTFSKAQVVGKQNYVDSDWSRGNTFEMTLTGNVTSVPAPVNAIAGQVVNLIIKQDATGGRTLTGWNSVYKMQNGVAPVLSTAANATDLITIICKSSTEFYVLSSLGYQ